MRWQGVAGRCTRAVERRHGRVSLLSVPMVALLVLAACGGDAATPTPSPAPLPLPASRTPTSTPFPITPQPGASTPIPVSPPTPFPITPAPVAVTPIPTATPSPPPTPSPTPVAVVPSATPAVCPVDFIGSLQLAVSDGRLHAVGAAAAPVAPIFCPTLSEVDLLRFFISRNILTKPAVSSIQAISGVGITVAPDGNPAGLPIPITSGFDFRTSVTSGTLLGSCPKGATQLDKWTVVCGTIRPSTLEINVDVLFIQWTSPAAGTGILPFLNIDTDGQPGNNVKPTAQYPFDTRIGGDALLQVVPDAKGKPTLEMADETIGKLKPMDGWYLSTNDMAAWVVVDPNPAARYLPGVYDYTGTDFTAPHVGFDVAIPPPPPGPPPDPGDPPLIGLPFAPEWLAPD